MRKHLELILLFATLLFTVGAPQVACGAIAKAATARLNLSDPNRAPHLKSPTTQTSYDGNGNIQAVIGPLGFRSNLVKTILNALNGIKEEFAVCVDHL